MSATASIVNSTKRAHVTRQCDAPFAHTTQHDAAAAAQLPAAAAAAAAAVACSIVPVVLA
jgi:hypothetical protein